MYFDVGRIIELNRNYRKLKQFIDGTQIDFFSFFFIKKHFLFVCTQTDWICGFTACFITLVANVCCKFEPNANFWGEKAPKRKSPTMRIYQHLKFFVVIIIVVGNRCMYINFNHMLLIRTELLHVVHEKFSSSVCSK